MRHLPLIPKTIPLAVTIKVNRALLLVIAAGATAVLTTAVQLTDAHSAPDLAKFKAKREKLKNEIAALNSDPKDLRCTADTDCDYVELGAKPCGGPRSYIVFSKKSEKASAVKRKAGEFTALDKKINEAEQMMSDCMAVLPPELRCSNSLCVDAAAPAEKPAKAGNAKGDASPGK